MRNAECGIDRTSVVHGDVHRASTLAPSTPHSTFHIPHWGGGRVSYRVGVDVGGTFTDLVALGVDGTLEVRKVTTTPDDPAVGMFRAVDLLGTREALKDALTVAGGGTGDTAIEVLVHGTTIATNALLERRGARVALVTTLGFEDLLWLRRQERASLYDLARDHPP